MNGIKLGNSNAKVILGNGENIIHNEIFTDATTSNSYKSVEYIESNGTQYIDTDVKPGSTTNFEIDVAFSQEAPASITHLTGACFRSGSTYNRFQLGATYAGDVQIGIGNFSVNSGITIEPGRNKLGFNQTTHKYYVNNDEYDYTPAGTLPTTLNIHLMHRNNNDSSLSNYIYGKLYGSKIWEGSTLVRDYIPVKNILTNEYGMFDKVNNKFYGNAGTGNFTGGNDIEYKEVEYIQSHGTEYIDTGINVNLTINNPTIKTELAVTTAGGDFDLFGTSEITTDTIVFNIQGNNQYIRWATRNTVVMSYKEGKSVSDITKLFDGNFHKIIGEGRATFALNIDDEDIGTAPTNNGYRQSANILIFKGRTFAPMKLKYFTLLNGLSEPKNVLREYVPVKNVSTNEYGLFDLVDNKFYGNIGTGAFEGGNDKITTKIYLGSTRIQ